MFFKKNDKKKLYNKGTELYDKGQYDEAIKWFDKVLDIDPNDQLAFFSKGGCFANSNMYDKAIECYDKLLAINNRFFPAMENKCISLYNLGRYEETIVCCENYLALSSGNPKINEIKQASLNKLTKQNSKSQTKHTEDNSQCNVCKGSGVCASCNGTKRVQCSCKTGKITQTNQSQDTCTRCRGRGRYYSFTNSKYKFCYSCNGTGTLQKNESYTMSHSLCNGEGWVTCSDCKGSGVCAHVGGKK